VAVPTVAPVTTPTDVIGAEPVPGMLDQVPPVGVPVSVTVEPRQMPEVVPMAGAVTTVTIVVAEQPSTR
jgi:hypothetical protein